MGSPLQPGEPVAPDEDLRLVHIASTSVEAYGLRARLEAEDIPVFVKGESEGPYRMAYTPVRLYVPGSLEVQARLVVAEVLGGALSLPAEDEPSDSAAATDEDRAGQGHSP